MTDPSEEATYIEKLYEYGEQLNNAKDKSQVTLTSLSFFLFLAFHTLFVLLGF